MARLLQLFGFLSVLLRSATLTLQSFTIGGIVFLVFVAGRREERQQDLVQATLRWIRRSAAALAITYVIALAASSAILMQSAGLTLAEVSGANFFLAGCVGIGASVTIVAMTRKRGSPGFADLLILACGVLAAAVMTSHAVSRLDHRAPLIALTALHQGATAAWIGGLLYLSIGLRRAPDVETARKLSARFSRVALASVGVLTAAGLTLGTVYLGSPGAILGTSYGAMVATKAVLFGLLLLLGAMNYQLVRRLPERILDTLKRFGEAEIGIGVTVILLAASLTSLPPAVDLAEGRVSNADIVERMSPRTPRLTSPALQEMPQDIYAAQKRAFEQGNVTTESYVPGQPGTRPNTPAEKAWSEYNHHWAGVVVLAIGLIALLAQIWRATWAQNWPLLFLGLAVFLILRSDPETWPLGPIGFWVSLSDPEVLLHRIVALLVIALAIFEWRVQTGRAKSGGVYLAFPLLVAFAGALLLTHSHSLGNIKEEVLAELSHAPLAILAVMAAWSRWLELRLPHGNRVRPVMAGMWPVCFALIGALLLNYREM